VNLVLAREVWDVEGVLGPLARHLAERAPGCLVGVVANVARSKRDVMGGRREVLLHGRRYVQQELIVPMRDGTRRFVLEMGAGSRLCAHPRALPEIAREVLDMCHLGEEDVAWHCFCGGGELSLALGAACKHVVAIGTSAAEVSELKRNLSANGVGNTTAVLTNLRSPWTLKQLSSHITHSQQRRLLTGSVHEQERARAYALAAFIPGEGRRRQLQRLSASTFNAPLLREDALAQRELQALLPAFVRDFRSGTTTLPVPQSGGGADAGAMSAREVPPEMESRLKRLYRRLALKCHPDRHPDDPEAAERFHALTRAYRALVGDSAGPEEEDAKAEDPFMAAMSSSYRLKFKHRWRFGTPARARHVEPSAQAGPQASADDAEEQLTPPGHEMEERRREEQVEGDEDEEDEDFRVKMEIDESWAQGPKPEYRPAEACDDRRGGPGERMPGIPEVVLQERESDLAKLDGESPVPTLPPPDVIVVSQPRNRKPGRGTPKHFHTWLRSTAARAIIYVSVDVEAFAADARALRELGYGLKIVKPFDTEPHRRSLLLVAKLELIQPLEGSEDYRGDSGSLLAGPPGMLPAGDSVPLLGGGGYTPIPPPGLPAAPTS